MANIEIWQPRWHDRVVLISRYKVGGQNYIRFTKTPSMPLLYRVAGDVVRSCPLETNGKIACYAVPIDKLEEVIDG